MTEYSDRPWLGKDIPAQTFFNNNENEASELGRAYKETVEYYRALVDTLLTHKWKSGETGLSYLTENDIRVIHICSGYPAKTDALMQVLENHELGELSASIVNVDLDTDKVPKYHHSNSRVSTIPLYEQSVDEFLAKMPEDVRDKPCVLVGTTVAGLAIADVMEAIDSGNYPNILGGFFTTSQPNSRAEPTLWKHLQDVEVVMKYMQTHPDSQVHLETRILHESSFGEDNAYFIAPKKVA